MKSVRLGELVEIKGGGTPDKSKAEYWGGNILWASVKDFKSTEISATADTITELGAANSATNIIPSGSIIVPTRMAVGKAAINTVALAINQDLKALTPCSKIDARYLLHALLKMAPMLELEAKGATVKGITLDVLRNLEIPLPPLNEQRRIAAILDQADALRRKRQRAIDRLNELGHAIFFEMFGDPFTNSGGWTTAELGRVCELNPKHRFAATENFDISFLPMAAVSESGFIDYEETRELNQVRKGYTYFERGDILLAKITPCFENGKACLTKGLKNPIGFGSTEFHVVRPGKKVLAAYIFNILWSRKFRLSAKGNMTGSAGQKRVPVSLLKELVIPLPPIELQREFGNRLDNVSLTLHSFKEGIVLSDALFFSLQHRAFTGQL